MGGPGIDLISVDLGYLEPLVGSDLGTVVIPRHSTAVPVEEMFPWEGVANVVYNESRELHPASPFLNDPRDIEFFREHWVGDAAGIIMSMINRASPAGGYSSANEAAYTEGQYAVPSAWPGTSTNLREKALFAATYEEYLGLAYVMTELGLAVNQPYEYFSHQDTSTIRGSSATGNLNDTCCTDRAAFGPNWYDRKTHYVSLSVSLDATALGGGPQ